jgi:hypothetical protein
MGGQKNTSDAKVYHIEGAMQNTQHGWTKKHKWCKGIAYRGNNAKHCVFCIVPSIWYTFASLVFFCPLGLCVLHCSLYMAKVYHIEETMKNTQSGWTEEHKWCKGISYRGNNAKQNTFASLVFFCPLGLCVLYCSLYMIYPCITCVLLSIRIVCFALFPLYDIPLHHLCFSVHLDCVFCIVPSIWSFRGNNAKHTIRMDRRTQVMQRYII